MGNELHALSITTMEKIYEIKDKISKIISSNNVCLFMKGTPENPQCGFSMTVSTF